MVEFDLKLNPDNKLYLKHELRQILDQTGDNRDVKAIANADSILIFSSNRTYEEIMRSFDVIRRDLKIRLDKEARARDARVKDAA